MSWATVPIRRRALTDCGRLVCRASWATTTRWSSVDGISPDVSIPGSPRRCGRGRTCLPGRGHSLTSLPPWLEATPHVVVCHGNLDDADTYVSDAVRAESALRQLEERWPRARMLVCGHTHHAAVYSRERGFSLVRSTTELPLTPGIAHVVNPGAVGQSRDGKPLARYAVFDAERQTIAYRELPYDHQATIHKMRCAGLVPKVIQLRPRGSGDTWSRSSGDGRAIGQKEAAGLAAVGQRRQPRAQNPVTRYGRRPPGPAETRRSTERRHGTAPRRRSGPTCSCPPTPNAAGPSDGCRPATLHPGVAQGDRQRQPRHRRRLRHRDRARPGRQPLGQPLHAGQRRRHHEVVDHGPGPTGLGAPHDDVMIRHHRRVDPDRDAAALPSTDAHSRVLSFSRTPPAGTSSKSSPPGDTGHEREGPRARSPSTTRSSRRHPTEHAGSPRRASPALVGHPMQRTRRPAPAARTAPIHSLNRVRSGTGPQRRSLSRARSPAEMRHR